jgi:hypothetical protein
VSSVFFTDRDLGKQFPAILAAAGLKVERCVDHFPDDCPDHVWLREIESSQLEYRLTRSANLSRN